MKNRRVRAILAEVAADYDRLERFCEDPESKDSIMCRISADLDRLFQPYPDQPYE